MASVLIGILLAVAPILLSVGIKRLPIGEVVDKKVPMEIDVKFRAGRASEEIGGVIDRVEKSIRRCCHEIKAR